MTIVNKDIESRILARGWVELKPKTFARLRRYMHSMPQFGIDQLFYCGLPVINAEADKNYRVSPTGEKRRLCY